MESGQVPRPSRRQEWIAGGIILLALIVGGAMLVQALRTAPGRDLPAAELTAAGAAATLSASAPPGAATPSAFPTLAPARTPTPTSDAARQTAAAAETPAIVRAKIEIVWPHDGADVRDADLANITAYLISGSGIGEGAAMSAPPCNWAPIVQLWGAANNQPAQLLAIGAKRMLAAGGRTYPVWDFNDIRVADARDPANKLAFFVTVKGVTTLPNMWAHASDARTIFPQPDVPTSALRQRPAEVDARIQIVWPHDDLPITEATRANVTAYLFAAGTLDAVAPEAAWTPAVRLHWSLNSEPERAGSAFTGQPRTMTTGTGLQFVAWDFNDLDISAARDPLNRMYFWVTVDGVTTRSNIWAHGADARTIFPQPDVLNSCK